MKKKSDCVPDARVGGVVVVGGVDADHRYVWTRIIIVCWQ